MLIISFDAVGDSEIGRLLEYPAFSAFYKQAAVYRSIPTIFVSNTYPIHASVATGVMPNVHGVISNTEPYPSKHAEWHFAESNIHAKTLCQAATANGIDTAAVFWPVTAYSSTIRYNIPEILPQPGKSQVAASLKAGSKLLQLNMILRYRKLLKGSGRDNRDYFGAACMAHILRMHKPGLALMHLTAYDSMCHHYGKDANELTAAFESLDANLALLLEAAGDDDVIIFSDHSQLNVHTYLDPNTILVEAGLLRFENDAYISGGSGCFFECCSGAAFFHSGSLSDDRIAELRGNIEQSEGFRRLLSGEEMLVSGYGDAAFGFCADAGYCYAAFAPDHKADHGYTTDMPDYKVFYMARGFGLEPGAAIQGGSLLDIAPLAARRLGISLASDNN